MKRYEEYKDSGVPWIGEIPKDWEVLRFSAIFSFDRGLPITKSDLKANGIPCISYGEIHSKYGFEVNPSIHTLRNVDKDYLQTNPNSILKKGDFVFADTSEDIKGSGNFTHLSSDDVAFAGYHSIIARLKNNSNYYRYIAYYFDSINYRSQIQSKVSGIKVFSITQSIIKNTKLLIPPLQTQQSIADYLDRKTADIDSLIEDKQKLIELLKEKRQAVISEAVTKGLDKNVKMKDSGIEWIGEIPEGWNTCRVKYIGNIKSGMMISNDLLNDEFDYEVWGGNGFIGYCNQFNVDKDCIVIGRVGAHCGNVRISKEKRFVTDNALILTLSIENYNINYLYYVLYSAKLGDLNTSNAQPLITGTKVLNVFVPCIELEAQNQIVIYLDQKTTELDNLVDDITTQIEKLKEYRQAIISEAVTGKVAI